MNRRRALTWVATFTPIGIAGCASFGGNLNTPDGMEIEVYYTGNPIEDTEEAERELDPETIPTSYQTVLANRSDAEDRLLHEDELGEFIQETDFGESYLLVVVAGWFPTGTDLELTSIDRVSSDLRVSLETEEPDGDVPMDLSPLSAVIRVTDDESGLPEDVFMTVDNDETNLFRPKSTTQEINNKIITRWIKYAIYFHTKL
ncbi:MAG: hypothetical protein IH933_13730 [Euryarchaeota archaeon]|jgi:hypothetical protein|nr:hypothetical protein [Euryarchaeota archaeon]